MQILTSLYIYPIKSTKAIALQQAKVEELGLFLDRRYMLIDASGICITARNFPKLTQVHVQSFKNKLLISAPQMIDITLDLNLLDKAPTPAQIWADKVQALHCTTNIDKWFSTYLNTPCQLVFCDPTNKRKIKEAKAFVSFADAYPILLINSRSLEQLNCRLENPVSETQLRPNLVVQGDFPFVEDTWKRIKIGEVEFMLSQACPRCQFINIDPDSGKSNAKEPLQTLASFRYTQGEVHFGQYLIALNKGVIKAGDEVIILETLYPAFYSAQSDATATKKTRINIEYLPLNVIKKGNNQGLLLEQAEQAGIPLPHACRNGICGRCRVKLISGEVIQLNDSALSEQQKEQGYILSCSCIPLSDISIDY
ncbi:MOSC domain-containing protein [Psychromonas sp. CNPT3]|uniref:YcbX family protein n=1 Tax=Psychromonas sp. CNPT3 TaxID=314282 RepID=UPI00006E5078|nr:MOSC N-terminal beta barrel domain-containing protein [Psychromonas sp. CNPT3]AGH82488.1 MOSC domain-containing protein [Psychromonas sp. CNPT3]